MKLFGEAVLGTVKASLSVRTLERFVGEGRGRRDAASSAEAKVGWKDSRTSAMHRLPVSTRASANLLLDTVTTNTASQTLRR